MTDSALHHATVDAARHEFRKTRRLVERAVAQLDDETLFLQLNPDQNSIAVIMRHMAGNMGSRWVNFLTSDGEKPDRHRDGEFLEQTMPRSELLQVWQDGWACLDAALDALQPGDLEREVVIRGESMPAVTAILRQISHYGQHAGQIVILAKHFKGEAWQYLSIPRGQSEAFNKRSPEQGKPNP